MPTYANKNDLERADKERTSGDEELTPSRGSSNSAIANRASSVRAQRQGRAGGTSTDSTPLRSPPAERMEPRPVQASARRLDEDSSRVHAAAHMGVSDSGQALPYLPQIQESFGDHDVRGVRAHIGGAATEAAESMGARAFATGNDVAFDGQPDLRTAAHEAAHVVQQRAGVVQPKLAGGVGREGDQFEQHADRVADLVVAGESAASTLSQMAGPVAAATSSVQLKGKKGGKPATTAKITAIEVVDGEAHVTIDKGSSHGIVPGTTGETAHARLTVYDVRENASKATTGVGLDQLGSDRDVTNLKVAKESKKEKRRRKQAHVVTAIPEKKTADGVQFHVRVRSEWGFNTYWRVELLNDDGSARASGTVVPSGDFSEGAKLVFPIRGVPKKRMKARLIPYFDSEKKGKR